MVVVLIIFVGGISTGVLLSVLVLALLQVRRKRAAGASTSFETKQPSRVRWWFAPWLRTLVRRSALVIAPVLANALSASFAIAQTTLQHVDPVVFTALQLVLLLPVAAVVLGLTLRAPTRESVRLGLVVGLPLGIGFVCVALSLRSIGIIPTALLTALDGLVASLIAWLVFHQRVSLFTCMAAICAGGGALLLWWIAPSRWQNDLVALACSALFTISAFQVESHAIVHGAIKQRVLPFFGGLFVSMAAIALVLALCFGRWETVQTMTPTDLAIVLFSGLGTVLIPLILLTFVKRFISAVTLAFLAVLEPLISIGFASVLRSLPLGLFGWCGVSLILLSMLFQANAGRPPVTKKQRAALEPEGEPMVAAR